MYYEVETNSGYDSEFSAQNYSLNDILPSRDNYFMLSTYSDIWNDYAQEILNLVNIERANAGVSPLKLSGALMDGAAIRANELTTYFSHTRPNGTDCDTVVENTYPSDYIGENIAAGYQTSEDVMNGWMNSTGHRENILRSSYSELGVGLAYDSNSAYGYHWVQLFGNPYIAPKDSEEGFTFVNYGNSQIFLEVGDKFQGEVWAENVVDLFNVNGINAEENPNDLILAGNSISNFIYNGTGNSSLWGGGSNVDDTLVGGTGSEMFWYGKYEGYDTIFIADSADTVNLYDASLSEITEANVTEGQVTIQFNTGTALVVYDNDQVTPTFQLADGGRYRYNRDMGQWQDS